MKKTLLSLTLLIFTFSLSTLSAQTISTVAGNGVTGFSGNGGQATAAELDRPYGVNFDNSGNLYIGDYDAYSVRMVNASGVISAFAGISGTTGFSGDGGPATAAELSNTATIYFDASGNGFIADASNNRIRMVNTSGIISTFAGNGSAGYSGDGGQATAAELDVPFDVIEDPSGNLYIVDVFNYRIREVNTSGIISTIVGNGVSGYSGDGGPATAAEIGFGYGIGFDAAGNLYLADYGNYRVRKVNTSGIISTYAGTGVAGYSGDGGQATAAQFQGPTKVIVDATGEVFVSDYGNSRIRKINTSGIISTVAGTGNAAYSGDGGPATAADLDQPLGMCLDAANNLYIADATNHRIREVTNVVTGTEPIIKQNDFSVYPNPANGVLTLQLGAEKQSGERVVEIYSMLGKKVYSQTFSIEHSTFNIDLSSLAAGTYLLKLQADDGSAITKKIEIAR